MIPSRFIAPLILAAAVFIAVAYFVNRVWDQAAEQERAKQEKANAEFVVRSNKGAVDFDTCNDAGGLFDFRRRSCQLP